MPKTIRGLVPFLVFLTVIIPASRLLALDVTPLSIGAAAPDFNLPGVDGKHYTLKDFADKKILVVLFTCNHCPTAQAYESRVMKLYDDFSPKGVALAAINPNDPKAVRLDELSYTDLSDTLDEMKIRAKERGFKFPYVFDGETQSTAKAYGVLATPHVFIFDANRKLRYVGAIDDSEIHEVQHHYARDAIEAMLAGKPVPVETSHVFGCSTKWADKGEGVRKGLAKWNEEPVDLQNIDLAGVKKLVASDSQNLRLVNVWATWCGPCVAEMSEFVAMQRMYRKRNFEVVTVSMDETHDQGRAMQFLKDHFVSGTNYFYGGENRDPFITALDAKWEGPIPHTMLIAPGGKIIYRHTGAVDPLEVKKYIVAYLGRTYAPSPGLAGVEAAEREGRLQIAN